MKVVKRYKFVVLRKINSGGVTYSMMTIVKILYYIFKSY